MLTEAQLKEQLLALGYSEADAARGAAAGEAGRAARRPAAAVAPAAQRRRIAGPAPAPPATPAPPVDSNGAARAIADLCMRQGKAELCAGFLSRGLSVGQVRDELLVLSWQAPLLAAQAQPA